MRLLTVILSASAALLVGPLLRVCDGQVILSWNPIPNPAVAGYHLCCGTSSGAYTLTNTYPSQQTTGGFSNLAPHQIYYFAVQGFTTNGIVSPFSNEATFTNGPLSTNPATAMVTWPSPAPIIYGAALNSNQLNATANVPGSFAYDPAIGAVLNTGANTLSVLFTPADTVDYSSVTNTTSLAVSQAPLIVASCNASRLYGAANPVFTGTITGLRNGDNITLRFRCSAAICSPAGTYAIVPLLNDPQGKEPNYNLSSTNGMLTVIQAAINQPPGPPPILVRPARNGLVSAGADTGQSKSSAIIKSAGNFRGIPPLLTMTMFNGQPNLNIEGTVGASVVIQATADLSSPDSWQTMTNAILTHIAPAATSKVISQAQNILKLAFVPAAQAFSIPTSTSTRLQYFRIVMPYDYAILGSIVLKSQGYTPRLIVVNMPGVLCDDACYVNEASSFIHYDRPHSALQLEESGASIREIADSLANSLNLDWTSASEFTFSNGLSQIWATVVRTEPPTSDPVAGKNPPSEPMVLPSHLDRLQRAARLPSLAWQRLTDAR